MLDIIYFYFDIVYLCISTTYNLILSNISGYDFAYVKYCMSHEIWHLKYNIPAIIVFLFLFLFGRKVMLGPGHCTARIILMVITDYL